MRKEKRHKKSADFMFLDTGEGKKYFQFPGFFANAIIGTEVLKSAARGVATNSFKCSRNWWANVKAIVENLQNYEWRQPEEQQE